MIREWLSYSCLDESESSNMYAQQEFTEIQAVLVSKCSEKDHYTRRVK